MLLQLIYLAMWYEMMFYMMDSLCDLTYQCIIVYYYMGGI